MRILRRRRGSNHAYCLARAEDLEDYVRAEIDNKTVAVGFFDRVYPRLRDSIGKLGFFFNQQLHVRKKFGTTKYVHGSLVACALIPKGI